MKAKIKLNTLLCSLFIFTYSIINSQTCTQCDNVNPPQGTFASEIGQNTTANGECSLAGGVNSTANGGYSFAFGNSANALGHHCIALGLATTADGGGSIAIGKFCTANGNSAFTIGQGFDNSQKLTNTFDHSLMIGFNSDRPTLFVSQSIGGVGKTGKIGIGDVTNPLAKLHIKADNGEEAMVFVEPYAFTSAESAKLRLGTIDYGVSAGYGRLFFVTGGNYIFNSTNAKVGIGTLTPTEKLEVAGNVKITTGYAITSKVQAIDNKGLSLTGTGGTGITVSNTGRVGIGTTSALTEQLEVNGNIKQSDNFKIYTSEVRALDADGLKLSGAFSGLGMVINSDGNIGIGTNPTSNRLEVSGTVHATLFSGNGSGLYNVPGDNLGNHVATQNFIMNGKWLSGDGGNEGMFVKNDGNVGIGIDPTQKLDVAGNIRIYNSIQGSTSDTYPKLTISGSNNANAAKIEIYKGLQSTEKSIKLITQANGEIEFFTNSVRRMIIRDDEIVIGIPEVQNYVDLKVNGHILSREVEVTPGAWWDEVLKKDYELISITELENYINQNGHLPEIPTEKEVLEDGIKVGEMQALLLKKIEELTLYVIELKKENELMKTELVILNK